MVSLITRTPFGIVVVSISRTLVGVFCIAETGGVPYSLLPFLGRLPPQERGVLDWISMPQAILGMELSEILQALGPGEPEFRARQVYEAIYHAQVPDLVQITTLPGKLRAQLASGHTVGLPAIEKRYESSDGARRYLLRLDDGKTVETVWMPEDTRDTLCISSQVG